MTFLIMLSVMLPFMLMILPYMQLGSNLCQGLDLGSELKYNLHGTVNKGKG